MEILTKISLLVITIILSTLFTGNVVAKTYPEYNIGEKITYNNMDFYVIASSDDKSDSVTLLKAEPLTASEVNKYGFGHINKYTFSNEGVAINYNGYGGMAYYSSETCGYIEFIYPGVVYNYESSDGCAVDYKLSDIKYIIDAWAIDKFAVNDLTEDRLGHKTRLITTLELIDNLGCSFNNCNQSPYKSWISNINYHYWTMSQYHNSNYYLWTVSKNGDMYNNSVYEDYATVRPVVTLRKKPIEVYYNISTKIDNHGVVKQNKKQALEDEKVTLFITANAGYKLNSLKIYKTNDNEDVTDKVSYNNETSEFIMPAYDVTVSAKFEKIIDNNETIEKENTSDNQNKIENPNTTDKISVYIIVSSLGVGALIIFMLCKRKFNIN